MMRRWLLAATLVLAGCSPGVNRPPTEVTAQADAKGVQHVRLLAHSYWFEPSRIVVKAGHPVELKMNNSSWVAPHNVTCNAADAGIEFSANLGLIGRGKTETFTPTKAGEYEFFCHVDGHAHKGMKGTIVVVP